MNFLKQPFWFLFDFKSCKELNIVGYLTILAVCTATFFAIVPKGDKKVTPFMDAVTDTPVTMTEFWNGGDVIANIPAGTGLRIYALAGTGLWAEDSRGNRGYVPVTVLGNDFYLLQDQKLGDSTYKKGSRVTLLSDIDSSPFKVRTENGTVDETSYPGHLLFPAEAPGIPDKGKNMMNISRKNFLNTFQPGKTFEEVDGHPLYAETITGKAGRHTAYYKYAVYDDTEKKIHAGVIAVFADGVLESYEWGTESDNSYNAALSLIPWKEALLGLPVIKDFNYYKPLGKTEGKSQEDIVKSGKTLDNVNPAFLSKILKLIALLIFIAIFLYALMCTLLLIPLLLFPLMYIRYIPNIVFRLLTLVMCIASTFLLFMIVSNFLGGNSLGDTGKLWALIILAVVNFFIFIQFQDYLIYNRCPYCGRMHTIQETSYSSHTGSSITDETTFKVTSIGDREIDRKAIRTDRYKTDSYKDVLMCRVCGRMYSHSYSITRKIGTVNHNN